MSRLKLRAAKNRWRLLSLSTVCTTTVLTLTATGSAIMQWVTRQLLYRLYKSPARHFIRSIRLPAKSSHNIYIWSKDSVANSVFIGLFCAMLPLPTQMIIAGTVALAMRAYLPLAVALVWLSNPITFIPLAWLRFA